MQIPIKRMKKYLTDNSDECKRVHSFEKSIISKSIFALFNKFINKLENMTEYESGLFVQSFDKWLDRKDVVNKPENNINVVVGDICMIDWNINYNPELSYVHPCLIIEDINNMIFAVPVSGQQEIIDIAYHPLDNPNGDKNYRRVYISDGFKKDSVLFISEAKVISKSRIINKIAHLNCDLLDTTGLFREIRWNMVKSYFPYEYTFLHNELDKKDMQIDKIENLRRKQQSKSDRLIAENQKLKNEISKLKK